MIEVLLIAKSNVGGKSRVGYERGMRQYCDCEGLRMVSMEVFHGWICNIYSIVAIGRVVVNFQSRMS
jgi:hypothetical protein